MTIWIDAWQLQCCGEPFLVGSPVTWTRYAPQPGDPRALPAVRGSAVLTDLKSAGGWTADRGEERFAGYIVQLAEDRGDGDRGDRP